MNPETARWARRYRNALRKHLAQRTGDGLGPAFVLGRGAVALGMETLDIARIHQRALTSLASDCASSAAARRINEQAGKFFTEAIVPIEQTHEVALKAGVRVNRLTRALRRRTREASASDHRLKRGIAGRHAVEATLSTSWKNRAGLLAEAHRLQAHLRRLTREILSAHENERRKTRQLLDDEIVQILVAINVRLLTLRKATMATSETLKKEIAETERLVEESAKLIGRFADEFEGRHEA